ncbi:hypothetical protein PROFUN_10605 [Planoprotostelium fungivorum]|uniref:Uncharacterized protein n=1 Tax=Planoprotostelium fungivorum TaxID=1890364 RepID=A0A2P6ND15_9EUKA|nr:hypothetical protein PROFUN_10605 [Planoprotostelium fungivorum]
MEIEMIPCWNSPVTAETAFPFGVAVHFFAAICRISVVSVIVISDGALLRRVSGGLLAFGQLSRLLSDSFFANGSFFCVTNKQHTLRERPIGQFSLARMNCLYLNTTRLNHITRRSIIDGLKGIKVIVANDPTNLRPIVGPSQGGNGDNI